MLSFFSFSVFGLSILKILTLFNICGVINFKWLEVANCFVFEMYILKFYLLASLFAFCDPVNNLYFKFSLVHYNRFLQFNYFKFNYSQFKWINSFNIRLAHLKPVHAQFMGFKIKCSGRFSRKQRASSSWFSLGSVPLNKVTSLIDYSAHTVFLANSAITVKVWINKGADNSNFYNFIL